MDDIVKKIQKLLTLANSDNENEAKLATQKANELLLKYNLKMQQVKDTQFEYQEKSVKETGLTVKPYQHMISSLLTEFFFVQIVIGQVFSGYSSGDHGVPRARYKKTLKLVGTKENCEIATYIFDYLNTAYPNLWKDQYERNASLDRTHAHSYYKGLTAGIRSMLTETKWKVEEEMGLVVVGDPGLDKFVEDITSGKSYGQSSKSEIDPDVYRKGLQDGKEIQLRKPIESTRAEGSKTLGLMYGKKN